MAPDGGWGWVIVLVSFLLHVIIDGISYAFGVLAADLVAELGSTRQLNGWIASVMVGVTLAGGPVASAASSRFGHRAVALAGSAIAGAGFAVSYFADSAWVLVVTVGIIVGFGMSLIYLPAIICVGLYFERYRSTAIGIAVCGAGVGTLVFSPLISILLHEYTWRGTMLILSAVVLQCAVFGALFRPLDASETDVEVDLLDKPAGLDGPARDCCSTIAASPSELPDSLLLLTSTPSLATVAASPKATAAANFLSVQDMRHQRQQHRHQQHRQHHRRHNNQRAPAPPLGSNSFLNVSRPAHFVRSIANLDTIAPAAAVATAKMTPADAVASATLSTGPTPFGEAIRAELRGLCRLELLSSRPFLLFLVSNLLCSVGFNAPYLYTPDRAQLAGHGETESALLVSIIGASNMVGRLGFGLLSDRNFVNRLWIYCFSLALSGLALAISCLSDGYVFSAVCCAAFGLFSGTFVTLTSPVLVDLLGLDKLSDSFGLTLLFQGVGVLIGPPFAGLLYDWTSSFDVPFFVCGVSLIGSGLVMAPAHWLLKSSSQARGISQEL